MRYARIPMAMAMALCTLLPAGLAAEPKTPGPVDHEVFAPFSFAHFGLVSSRVPTRGVSRGWLLHRHRQRRLFHALGQPHYDQTDYSDQTGAGRKRAQTQVHGPDHITPLCGATLMNGTPKNVKNARVKAPMINNDPTQSETA